MNKWWGYQQKVLENIQVRGEDRKILNSAITVLGANPEIIRPIDNSRWTGEWETSHLGFDEGEWLHKLEVNFSSQARKGGAVAMAQVAALDPDNPQVQMFEDNLDQLMEVMGHPEEKAKGAMAQMADEFGLSVDFYNILDWDKGEARTKYYELQGWKNAIIQARAGATK